MTAHRRTFDWYDHRKAFDRLLGYRDHYTSCSIYWQGLFTTAKDSNDPSYECDCGWWMAIMIVKKYSRSLPVIPKGRKFRFDGLSKEEGPK